MYFENRMDSRHLSSSDMDADYILSIFNAISFKMSGDHLNIFNLYQSPLFGNEFIVGPKEQVRSFA